MFTLFFIAYVQLHPIVLTETHMLPYQLKTYDECVILGNQHLGFNKNPMIHFVCDKVPEDNQPKGK